METKVKINIEEIIDLLNDNEAKNIICNEFEFKPNQIAMMISTLLSKITDYGYIIIGASKDKDGYFVNGLSNDFNIKIIVESALKCISGVVLYAVGHCAIDGKNVYAIKIIQNMKDFKLKFNAKINEDERNFITELYRTCALLQSNKLYVDKSEDERNDYIRDIMSTASYDVKDQTRQGCSPTGKNAGEVDLLFVKNRLSFTIVEALILKSFDKDYLKKHIDKIYDYDKRGHKFNVCLTYVQAKDFGAFWDKYCVFTKGYKYPYDVLDQDEIADIDCEYSEIRYMTTTLNRSNKETRLYHMSVHIDS